MKKATQKKIVYARYLLPVAVAAVLVILMLLPCYRFKDENGLRTAVSLFGLMGNSWDTVREYMFGGGEVQAVTLDFARTVMATVIALCVSLAVGVAVCVYSLVAALGFFRDGLVSKSRLMFVTLTVNRAVLCVLQGLMLPMFFLPSLLVYFYRSILAYEVTAVYTPFNLLYIAIFLYAAVVVLTAISKKWEMLCDMNIYTKKVSEAIGNISSEEPDEDDAPKDAYTMMSERAKAEQAERIRRLLNKDNDEEE